MTAKESIFLRCISIHGVPEEIEKDVLRQEINSQYNINIVRIEEVCGAEANRKLKRWILELEGELHARKLKNKSLELQTDEHSGTVDFKEPAECEVPSSWTMPQVPKPPKPTGRHQFDRQSLVAMVGAQSGYYYNLPGAGGYNPSMMSAQYPVESTSSSPRETQIGQVEGGDQGHQQSGQGQEQRSPQQVHMGQIYGQFSEGQEWMIPGHVQMGQGQEQMGHWERQMGQGHGQMGQGYGQMGPGHGQIGQRHGLISQGQVKGGQAHGQMGPYGPLQSTIHRDPSSGQYYVSNGFTWVPVTEEYIRQMQSFYEKPPPQQQQQQQQPGHEQTVPEFIAGNEGHPQESFKPVTDELKDEDDRLNVNTVEENTVPKVLKTQVKITHLPSSVDEDYVLMTLESKKMGSLSVETVVIQRETNCAEVQMKNPEDASTLIQMRTFQLKGTEVFVDWFDVTPFEPENEWTEQIPPSIIVTGLPEDTDEDEIKMFFENKRKVGVEVVDVQLYEESLSAVISFGSQDDVENVMNKCPLKFMGAVIHCERRSSSDTCTQVPSSKSAEPKILVNEIPENVDKEEIRMFFENKRKFGEVEIVDLEFSEESTSAIITYASENDVERVLGQCPLKLMGRQIKVQRFSCSDAHDQHANKELTTLTEPVFDGTQTKILVEDIPPDVDEDYLEMFFASKKLKSCSVEHVDFDDKEMNAVITFDSPEDVKKVLDIRPIKIKSKEVSVQVYIPKKLNTIIVRGPKELMKEENEDTFEMYFENNRKSGGGVVLEKYFRSDEKAFYITFEKQSVAKRVVERGGHCITRKDVEVELLIPSRSTKSSSELKENDTRPGNVAKRAKDEEGADTQPQKTVKVRGVNRVSSRDSVQWYFENKKKAGGGDIEKRYTDDEDDDVIYIQYKDESVAKVVAERNHTLEGHELVVSLYFPPIPPPSYPDKLLIKGLNPKITFSVLDLYMEARTGLTLVQGSMTYHVEQEDIALVTVDGVIDMEKIEVACKSKPLEGSLLRFSPVPISNCVLVSNISDAVTEDMVSLYFENTKRSNGGTVDKVEMFHAQNYCLVYFGDYKVVDSVLAKEQMLDGRQLEVRRYFPCIGRAEGDTVERRFKKPAPFTVKANIQKIKFLHRSSANKEAAQKQLAMCHATVNWPSGNDVDDVEILCVLSEDVKDCVKLAKNWETNAKASFEDFLNTLEVEHVVVVQDILKKVTDELGKLSIDNPEAVAILIQRQENKIYIVGIKGTALSLKKDIERIVQGIQEASEKEKAWIKTPITNMKPIETKMLLADKFPNQIEQKFQDVKVRINQQKNEIEIEGVNSLVNKTQIEMYQLKDSYQQTETSIQKETVDMYMSRSVKEYIVKKFKHQQVVAVWEALNGKLKVMSKSKEMLSQAVDIISKSVAMGRVQLSQESLALVQSDSWRSFKDSLIQENQGKLNIEDIPLEDIILVCTDDIYSAVLDKINHFLEKNTRYVIKLSFTEHIKTLLMRHCLQDLQEIAKKNNVILSIEENRFEISGTKIGVDCVKQEFEALAKKVQKKPYQVSKPGISEFMHSDKGRSLTRSVENSHQVLVKLSDEDIAEDDYNIYDTTEKRPNLPPSCSVVASCTAYGTRNIHVISGDMTDLTVDAIVNAADEKLSLCGGLGKAILKKGGRDIERACKQYIEAHEKLGEAAVFVSTAGNLIAKSIVHVAGPVWKDGLQEEDDKLAEVVFKAMHQASGKGYKSLALPAISCGAYGYPVKRATRVIVASVKNFFREVQESELTEIYVCDMKEDTVRGFIEGLEKEWGISNVVRYNRKQASSATTLPPGSIPTMDSSDEESTGTYSSHYRQRTERPKLPKRNPGMSTSPLPVKLGNISVAIEKAELAKQKIPVIVNTTSRNLDLNNGAVSKTILKQAGPEIQNELKQRYPSGIAEGEVAVTKGYNLKCTNVIHGAVSNWNGQITIDELKSFVTLCMVEAQKLNHSGIAFPAIGTGNLGYPREVVASEMFKAVSEFAAKYPQSPVSSVVFILYPKDEGTIKAFEQEITNWSTGGRTGRVRDYDHYENLHSRISEDGGDEHLYEELPSSKSGESNVFVVGKIRVTVKHGDISAEDVDCIINSSNETLDLSRGKVSQALKEKCGDKLVKQAKTMQGKMKKKGLAVTDAPNLKCKHIMHVVAKETAPEWKDVVRSCLDKAKRENYSSIAFPALGTGMKMNAAQSAKVMFQAVRDFVTKGCGSLTDVRIVIFQGEMVGDFILEAQQTKERTSGVSKMSSAQQHEVSLANPNVVTFMIYGMNDTVISQAIQAIDACIKNEVMSTSFTETIIKRLDKIQIEAIQRVAEKNNVDLQYISDKIEIFGIVGNVHTASTAINRVILDAIKIEHDKQAAKSLKDFVQWYYIEVGDNGDDLIKYPENLNFQIENAYRNKKDFFEYREDSSEVVVDLKALQEYFKGEKDEAKKTTIIRKDLIKEQSVETPKEWKDMKGNLLVHTLLNTDPNYAKISAEFAKTAGTGFTIQKIEMVQNKTLWQQYVAKKQQLEGQNPQGTTNERHLWHGTSADTVDSVNAHGFNRSYCGKNAVAFGEGVYFAVNASYSCGNTYSRPDANGVKRVYYCCVLTGEYTRGQGGMRVPPPKASGGKNALFDSVTDNPASPTMFIIFNDTQAYPLFIVQFK